MLICRLFFLMFIWLLSENLVFSQSITIIKTPSGLYEVPVTINGKITFNFIFDSGASMMFIAPDVFGTLRIRGGLDSSDYKRIVIINNAQGKKETCKVYNLKSITIGGKTIKNIEAAVSNSTSAGILLGQNVLSQFGKYSFDPEKNILIFGDFPPQAIDYITGSDGSNIKEISYPDSGEFGINILDKNIDKYTIGTYSMNALVPKNQEITVKISGINWGFPAFQAIPGWKTFDLMTTGNKISRRFKTVKFGIVDLEFYLTGKDKIEILIYENNSKEPTWGKTIIVDNN